MQSTVFPIHILLVDDDVGDVLLTRKALERGKLANALSVVGDGQEAMQFLRQEGEYAESPRPDLILLDLNMPRMDGRETLAAIKADASLEQIPVVVLTTSETDMDVVQSYSLQASCYITKPVDFEQFAHVVRSLENFSFCIVKSTSATKASSDNEHAMGDLTRSQAPAWE